ncbi:MAG TPA: transposase [Solirubrobacteraceae bacterium]
MARPTKLTPELQERIIKAVRAGNYAEAAARASGIAPSTYYRWLQRGTVEEHGAYRDFSEAVRQAEAEAEVHAVAILRRAMGEDWRAALAYLERRYPGRWRRHTSTELTGRDGGPIQTEVATAIDLRNLTDEELRLLEEMSERAAPHED